MLQRIICSQKRRLFVVVEPDISRPNDVTRSGRRPPRPHSLQNRVVERIDRSLSVELGQFCVFV